MPGHRNTTFLVIHGGGPHAPFRTLNEFAVNFWDALDPTLRQRYAWEHRARRRDEWIESYVSLVPKPGELGPIVHFHEYYWDRFRTRRVTFREQVRWARQAMRGHESWLDGLRLNAMLTVLRLHRGGRKTVSDLVLYTSPDVRSENFATRTEIQREVVGTLAQLVKDDERDRIVVFGHSLGSFIAYDGLNRVTRAINCKEGLPVQGMRLGPDDADTATEKLVGLVTCGSGLQGVADASRRLALEEEPLQPRGTRQWVALQVRAQRRGFERAPVSGVEPEMRSPFDDTKLNTRWLHFYHPNDAFSEELGKDGLPGDFLPESNTECTVSARGIEAHNAYWQDAAMYRTLAEDFVFDSP